MVHFSHSMMIEECKSGVGTEPPPPPKLPVRVNEGEASDFGQKTAMPKRIVVVQIFKRTQRWCLLKVWWGDDLYRAVFLAKVKRPPLHFVKVGGSDTTLTLLNHHRMSKVGRTPPLSNHEFFCREFEDNSNSYTTWVLRHDTPTYVGWVVCVKWWINGVKLGCCCRVENAKAL